MTRQEKKALKLKNYNDTSRVTYDEFKPPGSSRGLKRYVDKESNTACYHLENWPEGMKCVSTIK